MRGYPQFSFWISIACDMIYLSHIVIMWEKCFPLMGTVLKQIPSRVRLILKVLHSVYLLTQFG